MEACEVNVGTYSQMNEYMPIMITQGQGHSLTFVQGHSDSTFSNFFSSNTLDCLKPNFIWSLHEMLGMKMYSNVPGHKMASRPIYGKDLRKSPSSEPRVFGTKRPMT